jgi:hypothetical protein
MSRIEQDRHVLVLFDRVFGVEMFGWIGGAVGDVLGEEVAGETRCGEEILPSSE